MTTAAPAPRQNVVERLSVRDEMLNVVRVGAAVVVCLWLYLASTLGGSEGTRRSLLPYQALIQDRPAAEQRVFRELQEGLLEAETIRAGDGTWPTIDGLANAGIPPFAADPTSKTAYRWESIRDAGTINYLGVPASAGASAWLVLIQEPDPGTLPDQAFEDEEHHRLLDGTMLHVSTWSHASGDRVGARLSRIPQSEGWTQLYAVGPAAVPTR